ncbi:Csu type fimbrial protein [Acinetobacter indicus]|uniref:Csu type fimbrial protein n=2 Tax=Acinetobacter indicus TaxID=756892 RepID=UPI0014447550|nr:spore coat U domain-containing protein [Acinetobacter indicus]
MMKNSFFSLLVVGFLGLSAQQVFANCETPNNVIRLGPVSSFNVPSLNTTENLVTGGLQCTGTLSAGSTQYMRYIVQNLPSKLIHTNGVNSANISLLDTDKNIVSNNKLVDLSRLVILSFFSGPNSSVPFYLRVNESTNLVPGTYKGQFTIKWYWHIPVLGIVGLGGYMSSPNLKNIWGTGVILDWGTGQDATINIELIVEKDCKINAQNINFGTAPLVSKFNPVTGTVQITCSAQTPYTVGLSNGQNYSQNRRMKNLSSNHYLPYEIYKNTTTQRWGYLGADRWSSANASQNPGVYDGSVTQGYTYTAKIIDDGSNASVEGTYKDNLILEVAF